MATRLQNHNQAPQQQHFDHLNGTEASLLQGLERATNSKKATNSKHTSGVHVKNINLNGLHPKAYVSPTLTPSTKHMPANKLLLSIEGVQTSGRNAKRTKQNGSKNASSQIHGRKIDSPKIYVKELSERPKTSAQQARKLQQAKNLTAATNVGAAGHSQTSLGKNVRHLSQNRRSNNLSNGGRVTQSKDSYNLVDKYVQAPQTNKMVEQRKFDFGLPAGAQPSNLNSKESGGLSHVPKAGNIKKRGQQQYPASMTQKQIHSHLKTQTINYDSAGPPKSTTHGSHGGVSQSSKHVRISNKVPIVQGVSGKKEAQIPSTVQNSSSQFANKRISSQNIPKSSLQANMQKLTSAAAVGATSPLLNNFYLDQSTHVKKSTRAQKPPIAGGRETVNGHRISKKQQHLTQTKPAKTAQGSAGQSAKTQRATLQSSAAGFGATRRTKSQDKTSSTIHKKQLSKNKLNKSTTHGSNQTAILSSAKGAVNKSVVAGRGARNMDHFSFDMENKENMQGINLSRDQGVFHQKTFGIHKNNTSGGERGERGRSGGVHNDLSISSFSSTHAGGANASGNLGKLLGKNYFLDGEQLLRNMSPGTPDRSPKESGPEQLISLVSNGARSAERSATRKTSLNAPHSGDREHHHHHKGLSLRQVNKKMGYQTQHHSGSSKPQTQLSGGGLPTSTIDGTNQSKERVPAITYKSNQIKSSSSKGCDKLVKQNLKKKHQKDAEELIKKLMEETQRKQKKALLSQRNQEIKKLNASKIHKDKDLEQERLAQLLKKVQYKKKRSKSCINKTENIFVQVGHNSNGNVNVGQGNGAQPSQALQAVNLSKEREKSNDANKTSILSGVMDIRSNPRVKNCVVELSQLKREVNDEIRRDIREGKIDFSMSKTTGLNSTTNRKSKNFTSASGVVVSNRKNMRQNSSLERSGLVNQSANTTNQLNYTSLRRGEPSVLLERQNNETDGNIKNRVRKQAEAKCCNAYNTTKIQKFIDKQKKRNKAKKSLEQTIKYERKMKIKQNLLDLHNFTRVGVDSKKIVQRLKISSNSNPINIKKVMQGGGQNSSRQIQLLDHVRHHLPLKNLKAQVVTKQTSKGHRRQKDETLFEEGFVDDNLPEDDFIDSDRPLFNNQDLRNTSSDRIDFYPAPATSKHVHHQQPVISDYQPLNNSQQFHRNLHNDLSPTQDENDQIINITKKDRSSSKSNRLRSAKSGVRSSSREYSPNGRGQLHAHPPPLKQLSVVTAKPRERTLSGDKKSNYSKTRSENIRGIVSGGKASSIGAIKEGTLQTASEPFSSIDAQGYVKGQQKQTCSSQHFGVPGNSEFESLDAVRQRVPDPCVCKDQNSSNYNERRASNQLSSNGTQQHDHQQSHQQRQSLEAQPLRIKTSQVQRAAKTSKTPEKSPEGSKFKKRVKGWKDKYGSPISSGEKAESDPQMLIRLHSAAILIQYQMRKHLAKAGFYASSGEEGEQEQRTVPLVTITKQMSSSPSRKDESGGGTGQSLRRKMVPVLDLHKLKIEKPEEKKQTITGSQRVYVGAHLSAGRSVGGTGHEGEACASTGRSIFERNTFQELLNRQGLSGPEEFNVNNYPEMLKIREEAIKYRQKTEQKYINKMYTQKQFSPRTYQRKQKELEIWVSKENEEVKKTKKAFEEEWQKTAKIIAHTQQNSEQIKKILVEENVNSGEGHKHATRTSGGLGLQKQMLGDDLLASSARAGLNGAGSKRGEKSHILELIYEKDNASKHSQKRSAYHSNITQSEIKPNRPRLSSEELLADSEFTDEANGMQNEDLKDFNLEKEELTNQQVNETELDEFQASGSKRRQELDLETDGIPEEGTFENSDTSEDEQKHHGHVYFNATSSGDKKSQFGNEQQEQIDITDQLNRYDDDSHRQMLSEPEMNQQVTTSGDNENQSDRFNEHIDGTLLQQVQGYGQENNYDEEYVEESNTPSDDGQAAPEPNYPSLAERSGNNSGTLGSSLARVTSYKQLQDSRDLDDIMPSHGDEKEEEEDGQESPKLESAVDEEQDMSSSMKAMQQLTTTNQFEMRLNQSQPTSQSGKDKTHQEIAPLNMEDDLARMIMEVSPANSSSNAGGLKDELKESLHRDNYFLNQMNSGQATSFEELQNLTGEQEMGIPHGMVSGEQRSVLKGLSEASLEAAGASATGKAKIKIEIGGQSQQEDEELPGKTSEKETKGQQYVSTMLDQIKDPVSPISADSIDLGIMRGSVSLESSTSGEQKIKLQQVIAEVADQSAVNNTATTIGDSGAKTNASTTAQLEQSILTTTADVTTGNVEVDEKDQTKEYSEQAKSEKIVEEIAAKLTPEMKEKADKLSDHIFELLLTEMKMEMDVTVNREANQQNQALQSIQGQGIKTDLFAIEHYVDEVLNEVKGNSELNFLKLLNQPLSKDSISVLNQLQNSEIGSCEHFDESYPQVLPLDLYLTLEKRRKERREAAIEEEKKSQEGGEKKVEAPESSKPQNVMKTFLAECEHIHNKVLFDTINDSLLQFKPFGKEGKPLPWSRQNRRLKPTDEFSITEIFEIVKHDLFRWAITQAGTLPRREFVYQGVFDEELFSEIREKKLVSLLAREMIENEPKWLNYEFEQAQVKIDVGDMILEQLVNETIAMLNEQQQRDFSDFVEEPVAVQEEVVSDYNNKQFEGGRLAEGEKKFNRDFDDTYSDDFSQGLESSNEHF